MSHLVMRQQSNIKNCNYSIKFRKKHTRRLFSLTGCLGVLISSKLFIVQELPYFNFGSDGAIFRFVWNSRFLLTEMVLVHLRWLHLKIFLPPQLCWSDCYRCNSLT